MDSILAGKRIYSGLSMSSQHVLTEASRMTCTLCCVRKIGWTEQKDCRFIARLELRNLRKFFRLIRQVPGMSASTCWENLARDLLLRRHGYSHLWPLT